MAENGVQGEHTQNTQNTQSTQVVLTQQYFSRAELGEPQAGPKKHNVEDVICVLLPVSPTARQVIQDNALRMPEHVLKMDGFHQTTRLNYTGADNRGIALRLSSKVIHPYFGFTFGRNPAMCDIVLEHDSKKRISNMHFRIYVHSDGFVMLEDMSTNGTIVDYHHLRAVKGGKPATRLLEDGSLVRVGSEQEWIDFKVCLPVREDEAEDRYLESLQAYRATLPQHEHRKDNHAQVLARQQYDKSYQFAIAENRQKSTFSTTGRRSIYGMHWSGKPNYTVVGRLGQGAFATVYKLASRAGGELFAAKELEKRRFVKDGRMHMRLDSELSIMKSIRHPYVVNFVDYHEEEKHLYIIMEFVPNGDLQGYLAENGILPQSQAQVMSVQVLEALVYLHNRNITHRDIKPDNILVVSFEPMLVKLTDFGLSKVVKNNETFLKTFCGTLLYCAPEVFPDYEQQRQNGKRRHNGPAPKTFHSYSHSVDIWSYAAVLYFALCGKPAFEGVPDRTGYLMLKKILETPLDVSPLQRLGIEDTAIDLISKMLTKNPLNRPTDMECLQHAWLTNFSNPEGIFTYREHDLGAIAEEDEIANGEGSSNAFSQLSIREGHAMAGAEHEIYGDDDEVDFDDDDLDFLDPRASKRIKPDQLIPRNQMRDQSELLSSSIDEDEPMDFAAPAEDNALRRTPRVQRPGRLFGEIGSSMLQGPGQLKPREDETHDSTPRSTPGDTSKEDEEWTGPGIPQLDGEVGDAAASLLGAEAMVGRLQVHSPESAVSPANEPQTPRTPDVTADSSQGEDTQKPVLRESQDLTPKPPIVTKFNRRISIPISASIFYDENEPSTHSLEYASKMSGHDFVSEASSAQSNLNGSGLASIPPTMIQSLQQIASDRRASSTPPSLPSIPMNVPAEYLDPRPQLGLLVSTTDSVAPIFLRIENRQESWGRDPANTIVHPDSNDIRIGKRAIMIWHHAMGIERKSKTGTDWIDMPGLYTCITTSSSNGVSVNGTKLMATNAEGGFLMGRIHTGDVVTIFNNRRKEGGFECLKFVCTFYHGEGAKPRTAPFEVVSVK